MKRVSVTAIVSIAIVVVFFMIYAFFFAPDRSRSEYAVIRLGSESNLRESGENYILRYETYGTILRYSFETGEATSYRILPEGKFIERGGAVVDDKIYYVLTDGTVRRFDCENQTDEEVLSEEDIFCIYGSEKLQDEARVTIGMSEKCLILTINVEDMGKRIYICPKKGDLKTDSIEVNDLFLEEDMTGTEQMVIYQGIRIKRYYNVDKEAYEIIEFGEEESGRAIYDFRDRCTIKADGKLVSLDRNRGTFNYWVEGDPKEYTIDCMDNKSEYGNSVIQQNKLVAENGEIIGLVHVIKNYRCDSWNPSQRELKYDMLFRLNPETGENGILYRTRDNRTRIIGYQDGVIYLMNHYRIYTREAESGRTELFLKLPKDNSYKFDWQGDYLIVIRGYEIYGAYKVR